MVMLINSLKLELIRGAKPVAAVLKSDYNTNIVSKPTEKMPKSFRGIEMTGNHNVNKGYRQVVEKVAWASLVRGSH